MIISLIGARQAVGLNKKENRQPERKKTPRGIVILKFFSLIIFFKLKIKYQKRERIGRKMMFIFILKAIPNINPAKIANLIFNLLKNK